MTRLAYLNQLLRDYLGGSVDKPLYKWIHSRDKELFVYLHRLDSLNPKASVDHVPQVWEQRWSLAMWQAPPTLESWQEQFQDQAPWPKNGYYIAVDTPCDWILEIGHEPNERMTEYIIGLRRKELDMKLKGLHEAFKTATERREKEKDTNLDDYLKDKWTSFGEIPGKKGSTSFQAGI